MNIAIDTDPGHDDALAVLFASAHEAITVDQVTTVAGNATLDDTTRNAGQLLRLAGREDIPLAAGEPSPRERPLETAQVHGDDGLDGLRDTINPVPSDNNGVEYLAEQAADGATIITLGPLTNIAAALARYPNKMQHAEQIVSMGGALNTPGNQNRVAEYNIYVDPEAAHTVLTSSINTKLVPLGPCNDILFSHDDQASLRESSIGEDLYSMLQSYTANLQQFLDVDGALIYDAAAVFATAFDQHTETEDHDVVVETDGTQTRGMLVPEQRPYVEPDPNTKIVTGIDTKACKQTILQTLRRL